MIDVENSPLREGRVEILPNLFDMQDGQRRELRIEIRAGGLEREAHCPHCNGLVTRTGTDAGTVIQDGVDDMSREVMRRGGFPGDSNIRDVVLDYVVTLWPCGHRFRYAVPR